MYHTSEIIVSLVVDDTIFVLFILIHIFFLLSFANFINQRNFKSNFFFDINCTCGDKKIQNFVCEDADITQFP